MSDINKNFKHNKLSFVQRILKVVLCLLGKAPKDKGANKKESNDDIYPLW